MNSKTLVSLAIAVLAAAGTGCASAQESSSDRADRALTAVESCKGDGGVIAFDDDAVICGNGTFHEERGSSAVEACRGHGGVSAFDDDIVICTDQTFHRAEGG